MTDFLQTYGLGLLFAFLLVFFALAESHVAVPCRCKTICPDHAHCGMIKCAMEHRRFGEAVELARR